jgi:hypothetical protein
MDSLEEYYGECLERGRGVTPIQRVLLNNEHNLWNILNVLISESDIIINYLQWTLIIILVNVKNNYSPVHLIGVIFVAGGRNQAVCLHVIDQWRVLEYWRIPHPDRDHSLIQHG